MMFEAIMCFLLPLLSFAIGLETLDSVFRLNRENANMFFHYRSISGKVMYETCAWCLTNLREF